MATTLAAQETVVERFRKGQWGADVFIENGFGGAGLLRFTSPTRALVLNVSGSLDWANRINLGSSNTFDMRGVAVQLGRRGYTSLGSRVYRTLTVGVQTDYVRREDPNFNRSTNFVGAGLFADLGVQWMATPRISLGAQWGANLMFRRSTTSVPARSTHVAWSLATIGVRGGFYF